MASARRNQQQDRDRRSRDANELLWLNANPDTFTDNEGEQDALSQSTSSSSSSSDSPQAHAPGAVPIPIPIPITLSTFTSPGELGFGSTFTSTSTAVSDNITNARILNTTTNSTATNANTANNTSNNTMRVDHPTAALNSAERRLSTASTYGGSNPRMRDPFATPTRGVSRERAPEGERERERRRSRDRERDKGERYRSSERERERGDERYRSSERGGERYRSAERGGGDRDRRKEERYRSAEREIATWDRDERDRARRRESRDRDRAYDRTREPQPQPQRDRREEPRQQQPQQRDLALDIPPTSTADRERERAITPLLSSAGGSNLSLTVNYIPTKFSAPPSPSGSGGGARKRVPYHYTRASASRGSGNDAKEKERERAKEARFGAGVVPKMGGGVDAFRSGEARIGGRNDEDDDGGENEEDGMLREDGNRRGWVGIGGVGALGSGVDFMRRGGGGRGGGAPKKKLRWNRFKWLLFVANLLLTIYSFATLILILLTWFNIFTSADIIRVGNRPELIISTLFSISGILVALIGWAGILTNNRSFLALYTALLWVVFALVLVPGYMTYKRRAFNLEGKVNKQWSQSLGADGRVRIQNELGCCGYFSPFVEATVSQTCYARSILPGCKKMYLEFERSVLRTWYTVAFGAIVPLHLFVMIVGLLCSNHVTYRFGKGMMPKAYRLSQGSMAAIMDNYASQLAEQYGDDIAADVLARSKSNLNLQLGGLPTVPYTNTNNNIIGVTSGAGQLAQGGRYNAGGGGGGGGGTGGGGRI